MKKKWLVATMLLALGGCQPDTPTQQSAAPESVPAAANPVPAVQPTETEVVSASAEQAAESSPQATAPSTTTETEAPTAPVSSDATPVPAEQPAEVAMATAPAAEDTLALAKKHGCLNCHAVDKKVVGPAWRDVAAKYRGDAGAEERLMEKVAKGGGGVWGAMAMPPNPKLTEAERRELVKFILSLN